MAARRVVIDHMTIGVRDLERSRSFYRAALEPLGFGELGSWSQEQREIGPRRRRDRQRRAGRAARVRTRVLRRVRARPDGHNVEAVFHERQAD
jgi:catechol 2,3-dioxygenase-like lactoylglutathione lyase family enzyme